MHRKISKFKIKITKISKISKCKWTQQIIKLEIKISIKINNKKTWYLNNLITTTRFLENIKIALKNIKYSTKKYSVKRKKLSWWYREIIWRECFSIKFQLRPNRKRGLKTIRKCKSNQSSHYKTILWRIL